MYDYQPWLKLKLIIFLAFILSSCSGGSNNNQPSPIYIQQQPSYGQPTPAPGGYYGGGGGQYYGSPYQYTQPASRYYSNPYALPPRNVYPYYDVDQYYVPPTSYGAYNNDNPYNSTLSK